MAKLSIFHPNELSEKDFENLRGTSLMETLVRNRMAITFDDDADDDAAYTIVHTWLNENCKSNFYITMDSVSEYMMLYIEHENELLAFKMFFEQAEIPDYISTPMPTISSKHRHNYYPSHDVSKRYTHDIEKFESWSNTKDTGVDLVDIIRKMRFK